jgi:two-component system chemotaxis response regulator CheY
VRFLIVDDQLPMQRVVTNILARLGHTDVVAVGDAHDAIAQLETGGVDFVITDLMLPGSSGFDILRRVRECEAWRQLPVLVITGNAATSAVSQAKALGADGYVLKPFTADLLMERVSALCARRSEALEEAPI